MTARLNLREWAGDWPFELEDLRPEHAPVLVTSTIPRAQVVADAHTPGGVASLGLPGGYPYRADGVIVDHTVCRAIGDLVRRSGLRGLRCRSARSSLGAGRELAWFPATTRSRATIVDIQPFPDWYWS